MEPDPRNVLLTLSYDGTDFCGWQKQRGLRTVQETLEAALTRLQGAASVVHGSGRTDSGVHARCQGANFSARVPGMSAENYRRALNDLLPQDIRVHGAREVHADFHARFSAVARTYRYFIYCGDGISCATRPFVWHIRRWPDPVVLNRMAGSLRGEIDCTTFAAAGDRSCSRFRYLEGAAFFPNSHGLVFEITANAFLWHMVRSVVGTLIDFEGAGKSAADFHAALRAADRSRAGQTAPPQGLFLWNIRYAFEKG